MRTNCDQIHELGYLLYTILIFRNFAETQKQTDLGYSVLLVKEWRDRGKLVVTLLQKLCQDRYMYCGFSDLKNHREYQKFTI